MSNKENKGSSGKTENFLRIIKALFVLTAMIAAGWFIYTNTIAENTGRQFRLGLDLAGGSHLVYEADVSKIDQAEVADLMNTLRDVVERRVNVFGVSEPIVQVEHGSFVSDSNTQRLVVELPGVTDVSDAVAEIGKTPLLEFKLVGDMATSAKATVDENGVIQMGTEGLGLQYIDTGLTGRYLQSAALEFSNARGSLSNDPIVSVTFNSEGADLFEQITRDHVGENLAIFLDGEVISSPRINEAIAGGRAIISGGFTPDEAKVLATNLNFGALPVPIELQSTQTIGASLGNEVLGKGIEAGMLGIALVIAFLLLWYRMPGAVAAAALFGYVVMMLALFLYIPVTLTAAGLAGFILSLGMAVDANVLVFERMKEEYKAGKSSLKAADDGFKRAWGAIRDGNVTSLLSAIILFWFGTSIVKGFALVFGIGVIVSMFSAIFITKTLLRALPERKLGDRGLLSRLFKSGF